MKRLNCPHCQYPINACLCASIRPLSTSVELIVLQDPSEVKHAKNSVKLMKAVMKDLRVVVGETTEDFMSLRAYLDEQTKPIFVLYPSEVSLSVGELSPPKEAILLLLDGTWRKAFKLLKLNPWLNQYPAVHLDLDSPSHYTIRKAKRSDSLSTLEAAAMAISIIEPSCDVSPLTDALSALVDQRLMAMPLSVRQRYLS
ncbi:tRNA-uridine aminocarboxypropyltransferase [Shewanella psychrotolerans]|uniref:tRNA-uridine aminocarboxypropyltransferase n=1 Tax=Shewanella psychrotolerans TaxID=2864206 RepID=UPI001C656084|nr:tRNA-uridine aminocarboxypropyltransferase [Shewanella psychrotolerans]QYK01212.1 DTW domain-containing protein [Shewanella psychrotolerans]